jgi:hypothetical protein
MERVEQWRARLFSKRFEDAAAARQFQMPANTMRRIDLRYLER